MGGINIVCACLVDKIIEHHQNAEQLLQLLQQHEFQPNSLSPAMPSRGNQTDEREGKVKGIRQQQAKSEAEAFPRPC